MATKKANVPYWEKLRDPRWQKKRLEILERDGWKCRECGSADATLNVHHGRYLKDCEPWEYENDSLQTLCDMCHESRHVAMRAVQIQTSRMTTEQLDAVEMLAYMLNRSRAASVIESTAELMRGAECPRGMEFEVFAAKLAFELLVSGVRNA